MIDQALLNILACPKCKNKVDYNNDKYALLCQECQLAYPIRDSIPVMLIDEAKSLAEK